MLVLAPLLLASSTVTAPEPVLLPTLARPAIARDGADRPGFSYSYVEVNYTWVDSDNSDTLDGAQLTGSLELPLNLFIQGSAWSLNGDVDLTRYRLGAGWHLSLGKVIDGYAMLSWVDDDFSGGISDENGITGDVGLRFQVLPKIEVNGYVEWADIEESETGVGLGGRYYLSEALSLGAGAFFIDSGDQYNAGLRFQF